MKNLLIIGAKSDIAKATAREFAKEGFNLILAGRNIEEIEPFKRDIEIRYNVEVQLKNFDVLQFEKHQSFYQELSPKPDGVLVAAGIMYDQKECEKDFNKTLETINVNFTGLVSILNIIANDFEKRGKGFIIGISSVAGDRGRAKNYIYGSSKAAFSAYLSGLRNRLSKKGIKVITVKPGFVYTKMTEHMDLPKRLTATPEVVAKDIIEGFKKDKDIIYTKKIWFWIMCVIKHIPEKIFKKLDI